MKMSIKDVSAWSEAMFGQCILGDKRLTKRLVTMGEQLSRCTGSSLAKSCVGQDDLLEGGYRFLRNKRVKAEAISTGGYEVTASISQSIPLLLAIEDTTTLSYSHMVREELGPTSNSVDAGSRGYLVHSTMLMDAHKEKTVGLIAQERWCRDINTYGKRKNRKGAAYEEKESYKWEKNTRAVEARLGEKIKDVLFVCDREADIYDYIQYKIEHNQRFIVRAQWDRKLENSPENLYAQLEKATLLDSYLINVAQKNARKERCIELNLKSTTLSLSPPKRKVPGLVKLKPITVNVVVAIERNPVTEGVLEWILFTTEPVRTFKEARAVTRYYELRWRIEEFHKAWKTGTGVEKLRMQTSENLEKMIVILSFLAIRLLQLKEYFEDEPFMLQTESITVSCDELLTETEWKVLWHTIEKKDLPLKTPSAAWAYKAIAKLGGWNDSKKTGKASWATIWEGWYRLTERVDGFRMAQQLLNKM
jgi:hypothetical protein